jgi:hypothetical protein
MEARLNKVATTPKKAAAATPEVALDPLAITMREAERISGLSVRTLYRDLAAGRIRAVKRGSATLVLMDSLRAYLAALPPATFGSKRAA